MPSTKTPVRATAGQPGRPTAQRTLPLGKSGGALMSYFREVRTELRKVVWPTRQEALNLTAVTLALSVAVGIFLGGIDFIFQEFFRFLLRSFAAGSG